MNQPITAESLAALRQSSDFIAAVCDRAAKCDHLEARNKALQESNDGIAARHGVLQAVIRKAREGLSSVLPECDAMSLPELVTEAAARIRNLREAAAAPTPHPGDAITIALRLARRPVNDLERYELGGEMIPHLQPGEDVDTGALRILADRVEWLEKEAEECRVMLHDVASGRADSRVMQELDAQAARGDELFAENKRLTAELAESRAELGRQAATIAELLYAEVKPLRLEVGKTYARRDGNIDRIVGSAASSGMDFHFRTAQGYAYREDGRFCAMDGHPADLVALATTSPPP